MQKRYLDLPIMLFMLVFVGCSPKVTSSAKDDKNRLSVMSYNVHHCNPPSKEGIIDVAAIAAVIKKENPDIVALQEIDVNTGRSGKVNQAQQIALKAGYSSYFFAKAIDFDGGQYGIAILSKFPLSDTKIHQLPTDEITGGEHRVLATATVTLPDGNTITMACTHLDAQRDNVNRLLQVKEINRVTGEISGPFVIGGDFNAAEGGEVINVLDERFTRTCQQCKIDLSGNNESVIDFIGFRSRENFAVISHQTIPEAYASDHFPVISLLQLNF
jgi:endonuclease/exonuclease/phosphatase family metal-dependent hydrolase